MSNPQPQDEGTVILDKGILGATGFAEKVGAMAIEGGYSYNDIFNGISIAATTLLVELCIAEGGKVDTDQLAVVRDKFIEGFKQTVEFATQNIKAKEVMIQLLG